MPDPLQFHFDFSSPYGYLASEKIEALAARHGRRIDWRPMLLGVAFKATGSQPLTGRLWVFMHSSSRMKRIGGTAGVRFL